MEFGAICLRDISSLALLPEDTGFGLMPRSISHMVELNSTVSEKLLRMKMGRVNYAGNSPYFHLWSDHEEVTEKKTQAIKTAVSLHNKLCSISGVEAPFCLFTEPFGTAPNRAFPRMFGKFDYSQQFCRGVVSEMSELGVEWISISQNRIRDERVAEATIAFAKALSNAGIETSISWQCWAGWGSFEDVAVVWDLIQRSEKEGVGAYLGEVGIRYSSCAKSFRDNPGLMEAEHNWIRDFVLPRLEHSLAHLERDWKWWSGNPSVEPSPGQLVFVDRIQGVDIEGAVCNDFNCLDEGSARWGVRTTE